MKKLPSIEELKKQTELQLQEDFRMQMNSIETNLRYCASKGIGFYTIEWCIRSSYSHEFNIRLKNKICTALEESGYNLKHKHDGFFNKRNFRTIVSWE